MSGILRLRFPSRRRVDTTQAHANGNLNEVHNIAGITQQILRHCQRELDEVLTSAEDVSQEQFSEVIATAKGRFLRLSLLLEAGNEEAEGLIHEARQCVDFENHSIHILQCGEQMGRWRATTANALATRQHATSTAAAMLGRGPLHGAGWPLMMEHIVTSVGQPYVTWPLPPKVHEDTQARVKQEMFASVAASEFIVKCGNKQSMGLKVTVANNGLRIVAPSSFKIWAVFDLRRWRVLQATIDVGFGHGLTTSPYMDKLFRERLQKIADEVPAGGDVPGLICQGAYSLCSYQWLRILNEEAQHVSRQRQLELSSVWLDRRGSVTLRVCPQWDPTGAGLFHGSQDSAATAVREVEDTGLALGRSAKRNGCTIEFHQHGEGGVKQKTFPSLGLNGVMPSSRLDARGQSYVEDLLAEVHQALAKYTLQRIAAALVDSGHLDATDVRILPSGPVLQVVCGCVLNILMDTEGRVYIASGDWSEQKVELSKLPADQTGSSLNAAEADSLRYMTIAGRGAVNDGSAAEGFFPARIEAARLQAIDSVIEQTAESQGWACVGTPKVLRNDNVDQEDTASAMKSAKVDSGVGVSRKRRLYTFEFPGSALGLQFELYRAEVSSMVLCLNEHHRMNLELRVAGLERFSFYDGGLKALRDQLGNAFAVARRSIQSATLGADFLASLSLNFESVMFGMAARKPRPGVQVSAEKRIAVVGQFAEDGLKCSWTWPDEKTGNKSSFDWMEVDVSELFSSMTFRARLRRAADLVGSSFDPMARRHVERLASGATVAARCEHGERTQWVRELTLAYNTQRVWRCWARDLTTLDLMCSLLVQTENTPVALASFTRLKWQLRAGEVFEFGEDSPAAQNSGAEAEQAHEVPIVPVCSFRWCEPSTDFFLGQHLTAKLRETRDLHTVLHMVSAAQELGRAVSRLPSIRPGWSCSALSPESVGVLIDIHDDDTLGVELRVDSMGTCSWRPYRRPQSEGSRKSAQIWYLDKFMQVAMVGSSTDASKASHSKTFKFLPGTLEARLEPLWQYLQTYQVLLTTYRLLAEQGGTKPPEDDSGRLVVEDSKARGVASCTLHPLRLDDNTNYISQWGRLEWVQPALDATCTIYLCTHWNVSTPKRSHAESSIISSGEPAKKAARTSARSTASCEQRSAEPPRKVARTDHAAAVLENRAAHHQVTSAQLAGKTSQHDERCRHLSSLQFTVERKKSGAVAASKKADDILDRFQTAFDRYLKVVDPRVWRLWQFMSLMNAPCMWMLDDVSTLLLASPSASPRQPRAKKQIWNVRVDTLSLRPTPSGNKYLPGPIWRLKFQLANPRESITAAAPNARRFTVECHATPDKLEPSSGTFDPAKHGWEGIIVSGEDIEEWAEKLMAQEPKLYTKKEYKSLCEAPYHLTKVMHLIQLGAAYVPRKLEAKTPKANTPY